MQPAPQQQPTPKQFFEEAHRLMRVGDVFEAARRAGKLRSHFPDDPPVLALHGLVLARMGIHAQALGDLIRAAQLTEEALEGDEENPARPRIVDQLIRLSVQIGRSSMAIQDDAAAEEAIETALRWDPERADAVAAKAELLAHRGRSPEALALIDEARKNKLDPMPLVLAKGGILLEWDAASDAGRAAVVKELEEQASVPGHGALDLGDLLRTIGAINDRLGREDDAFKAFRRAAKLRRDKYDPRHYTTMTTRLIADWSSEHLGKLITPEESGQGFVLVLGAPHSGVAQLADMLAQFEDATVLGPLETLSSVCVRHLGAKQGVLRPVPMEAHKLRGGQLREGGRAYAEQIMGMGALGKRAIDTHPLNIPLAGAAAVMLPGINIVMCRRDPLESALACFCDAMIGNHPYAGDLLSCAGFVADSNRMLDHWVRTLGAEPIGANIVEVQYQDLIANPARAAARVANEIGLDASKGSITSIPRFDTGPGSHPERYRNYTRQIRDLLGLAEA